MTHKQPCTGCTVICEGCAKDNAKLMLQEAAKCLEDRASERDIKEERSMKAAVEAFNAMFDTQLTEEQGWHFMVLIKMSRSKGGAYRRDDYVDGAAYFGLAGESRSTKK